MARKELQKIYKTEVAEAIAKTIAESAKRQTVETRFEAAKCELLNLAIALSVYHQVVVILNDRHDINVVKTADIPFAE